MDIKINKTPESTREYPHHSHRQYEIMHYLSGEGEMWTEMGSLPFSCGTVIIMPPGVLHGSSSENEFINISIECDFDGLLIFDSPRAVGGADCDEGAELVRLIWENRYKSTPYVHSLCIAYAQYLLQKLNIEGGTANAVRSIANRIFDEACDPQIDVNAMLRKSGYAEDYIRMCFKRTFGRSPITFLTEIRIKHACYMIDIYKNSMPLSEISERCGYTDYVYFSKKFKSITGMSPKEYKGQ